MKIVLDTNVLSVAISRRSKFYPIWQAVRIPKVVVLSSEEFLEMVLAEKQ